MIRVPHNSGTKGARIIPFVKGYKRAIALILISAWATVIESP